METVRFLLSTGECDPWLESCKYGGRHLTTFGRVHGYERAKEASFDAASDNERMAIF